MKILKGLLKYVGLLLLVYILIGWSIGLLVGITSGAGFLGTIELMLMYGIVWPPILGMVIVMGIAG